MFEGFAGFAGDDTPNAAQPPLARAKIEQERTLSATARDRLLETSGIGMNLVINLEKMDT